MLDGGQELEFAGGFEEAGFDGVGGQFAHLFEREGEDLLHLDVFVEEVRAEHGGVVGVEGDHEAAFEVFAQGVGLVGGAAAGADVRGEVDFNGDLALGEDAEEVGVVLGGEAVADAFGADVESAPNRGGAVDGGRWTRRHGR